MNTLKLHCIQKENTVEENNDDNLIYFEISIRYYKTQDDENFEIILNDISRIKIKEKKDAEFKYKSIFS